MKRLILSGTLYCNEQTANMRYLFIATLKGPKFLSADETNPNFGCIPQA